MAQIPMQQESKPFRIYSASINTSTTAWTSPFYVANATINTTEDCSGKAINLIYQPSNGSAAFALLNSLDNSNKDIKFTLLRPTSGNLVGTAYAIVYDV